MAEGGGTASRKHLGAVSFRVVSTRDNMRQTEQLRRELMILEIWQRDFPENAPEVNAAQRLWRTELLTKFQQIVERN
jgi:hypothetical protein